MFKLLCRVLCSIFSYRFLFLIHLRWANFLRMFSSAKICSAHLQGHHCIQLRIYVCEGRENEAVFMAPARLLPRQRKATILTVSARLAKELERELWTLPRRRSICMVAQWVLQAPWTAIVWVNPVRINANHPVNIRLWIKTKPEMYAIPISWLRMRVAVPNRQIE